MRFRLILTFTTIFTIISTNTFCQIDFKKGYIITLEQDTIYGHIKNKSTNSLNTECEFIPDNSETSRTYNPIDIRQFRIENEKSFISKHVEINGEEKVLFLEFLLEGVVNLYYSNYQQIETYYIEKGNKIYTLTNNKFTYQSDEGKTYERFDNKYIGTLMVILKDEPQLIDQINATLLTHNSLIKLTKNYHNLVCSDRECITYEKEKNGKTIFRPYIGLKHSIFSLNTSEDKNTTTSYNIGVDFCFPTYLKSTPRWNVYIGINLSKDENNTLFNNSIFDDNVYHRIYIKHTTLQIPISLEYTIPMKKISPFLSCGYSNIFLLNKEAEVYRVYNINTNEGLIASHLGVYQSGLNIGAGLKVPMKSSYLFCDLTYQYRFSPSKTNYMTEFTTMQTYSINLGWAFNGNSL